jgi:hypothetical protein
MNKWVSQSIKLAKGNFYLDKLLNIYPLNEVSRELIVEEESPELKTLLETRDCFALIKELIRLKKLGFKFPIDNPYISFLSHYKEAIEKNPKTVKVICESLYKMDYRILKERLEAPKRASRRIGPMFRNWLKRKFEFVSIESFANAKETVFLDGGDRALKVYAEKQLGCNLGELSKGLDFVAKVGSKYVIGTAKFITDFGGSQDNQFFEAIRFVQEVGIPTNIVKIAIIDGVAWLDGKMLDLLKKEFKNNEICLSALLLKDFLIELK